MTVRSFTEKLTHNFGWRQERRHTFAALVVGALHQGNVRHHALSQGFTTPGSYKSKLEKTRRFFAKQDFDYPHIAKEIVPGAFGKVPPCT